MLLLRLRQSDGAELEEDETSDSGNSDSETDAGESTQPEEQEEQPEEQEEQPEEQQQQVVEEEDAEEEIAGGSGGFRGNPGHNVRPSWPRLLRSPLRVAGALVAASASAPLNTRPRSGPGIDAMQLSYRVRRASDLHSALQTAPQRSSASAAPAS